MSYGYGGVPDWPMIQARRRAEREASSARGEAAGHRAAADRWKVAFEALAGQIRSAVSRTGAGHRDGGQCGCSSCWEKLIARLAQEAQGSEGGSGEAGTSTFSFSDLFGGAGPEPRP
ncbi:hypothetical protein [Streptomyces nigrescens]|uniref:Uncharacterized protein n=1 Tax=Streptomyces nigrescens TaxID=1920 RepID=A0A640TTV6_STRNI|nr:hypothetical protein [Streptomyces libani]WAT94408.1 hypothetical protein STRLI_000005 [Streptomyces libani subsp. libani]WAU01563.1 hypothetical protein STRLI_007939 [Streptomyces libani subsp. libani]GFE27533.1 hypothetical protein Sliba_79860 [Streptomyces libani subsp. libani]GGW08445.1 hypothetical protein GCM10010500_79330 [Streptomyces libani subsp. libani]